MADEGPTLAAALRPRVRLVGRAAALGAALGVLAFFALVVYEGPVFAGRKAFGVGALLFGFAMLGWSGSILAGSGIEAMQEHLAVGGGWTERDSRRAMARIGGIGAGWMAAVAVVDALA